MLNKSFRIEFEIKFIPIRKKVATLCTYYVRDLSGNILSIYTGSDTTAMQKEMAVYGSGRLGTAAVDAQGEFIESYLYELTDHLGNVRATLKDNYNGNGLLNSYADYYPGGMLMPGGDRTKVASSAYKFGYQGQFAEKDQETGFNQFELRLYDARIGRWNVPDPYGQYFSPYSGMGNNWVNTLDPDGGWVKGAGIIRNVFRSDYMIAQKATERANSGPASTWFAGCTEEGFSSFVVMGGSEGQVLHENPGLFRNLINKHGSSALGQELWMSAVNYEREQSSKDVLNGIVLVYSVGTGLGGVTSLVGSLNAMKTSISVGNEVAVHGNSLKSLKPTWGYKLYTQEGTFLKNGITSNLIPEARYTKSFMSGKKMVDPILFPNRAAAYEWEFMQNKIHRGPLNLNMH